MAATIAIVLALTTGRYHYFSSSSRYDVPKPRWIDAARTGENAGEMIYGDGGGGVVQGGHWERDNTSSHPYIFSPEVCATSFIDKGDCRKTINNCQSTLMNWTYIGNDEKPYPRFDVDGFREKMSNRSIVFIGSSMIRQQVQALIWTLGHENVKWDKSSPSEEYLKHNSCTASRFCTIDTIGNITICYQFMGSMATQIYHEGNYTLDHSLRGHGDSSCLLQDEMIAELVEFNLVFVQTLAWWTRLGKILDSPTSPSDWVNEMLPKVYYDATGDFLTKLSQRTDTVLVLGQTGTDCRNKTTPEPFSVENIENKYGWSIAPKLWDASLAVIQDMRLDVHVVDAREPLMQSVHAHPSTFPDCLHFCMDSAAINIYLDMYWNEVFSL